jgi:predicted site-specific integrase-resolvase
MNAMSVPEFGRRLGISRASAYRIVASGEIALVDARATGKKVRVRISEAAYERFLAKREIRGRAA